MTLREYLYLRGLTIEEFAEKIKYNKDYLSRVMRGRFIPSARFVFSVEKVTKGKIKGDQIQDNL